MKPPTPPNTENTTKKPTVRKAASLTSELGRDSHDQAFLMLGGVDVARAEQDGEGGHRQAR